MNTYNEIKKILLSEKDLDMTTINSYLDIDYKTTINIIFDIFYDSITTCTYTEINLILYNIELIINLQDIDKLKIINNKVREVSYRLSKLNINTIELKNIKLILIDLNRKMRIKKETSDNYNAYILYNHLIFNERDLKTVELLVKNKQDILLVTDELGNNIFYNILEAYLNTTSFEDRNYFYDVIIIFLHNLDNKLLNDKQLYLDKLSSKQDKDYVRDIMMRIRNFGKVDEVKLERKYHISSQIHDEVLKELESFKFDIQGRTLIDSNFVTIDDKEALCLDDALSLVENKDGSYSYYVAITDIPSLIPYKSKTYYDALSRVETLYLIDKNISLYHPNIANNLCSLLPGTPKNVLVYKYLVDPSFNLDPDSIEIVKGIITVDNRLTYDMVDSGMDIDYSILDMLEKISLVTNNLRSRNTSKEEYRRIENYIKKRADYHPSNFADRSVSANIVQESMLLVNSSVPKYFRDRGYLYLYRNHQIHNKEYADHLFKELTKTYAGKIPREEYEKMIKLLSTAYLSAYYSGENKGHEGLGYKYYSHSSSAARRFADSYDQYLTYFQLFNEPLSDKEYYDLERELHEVADHINERKRENTKFQNEYNYLCSKGKILERRK